MLSRKLIVALMFILMLAAGGVQAGGDAARGAELSADCADCHGEDGLGDEDIPGLAGMPEADQVQMLMDFQSGAVESEDMADIAADLSEQDIHDLAAYYAGLGG